MLLHDVLQSILPRANSLSWRDVCIGWQFAQIFKQLAGCILFSALLCGTFGPADELRLAIVFRGTQPRFHRKRLTMLGAMLLHQHVCGLRSACRLQLLLQGRLVITQRQTGPVQGNALEFRADDLLHYKLARSLEAAVEVNSCENGLKSIHEQSRLVAASALFFTSAKAQIMANIQELGYPDEMLFAYEVGP